MSSLCSVPKCTMSHIKAKRENFKSLPIFSIRRPEFAKSEDEKNHREVLTKFILSVRNPDDPKDNIKHQLHKESAGICSRHFEPEDIIHFKDLAKLRVGAIPTRHLPIKDDETDVAEIQEDRPAEIQEEEDRPAEYMEIDIIEVSYDEQSPGSSMEEAHSRKEEEGTANVAKKEKPKQKSIHQIVERIKEISSTQQDSDSNSVKDGENEGQDNVNEDQQQQQHKEMKADNSFSSIDGIKKENTNLLHRSKSDSNDTDEGLSMTGNSTTSLVMYANNNLNGGVPTKRSRGRPRKLNPDGSYARIRTSIPRKRPAPLPSAGNRVSLSEGDMSETSFTSKAKRPRGRPRKVKPNIVMPSPATATNIVKVEKEVETVPKNTSYTGTQSVVSGSLSEELTPTKRPRGRPRKIKPDEATSSSSPLSIKKQNISSPAKGNARSNISSPTALKQPKGRQRKQVDPSDLSGTIEEFSHTLSSMQLNRRFGHEHPRNLIPEMCRLFYKKGWMPGTGGAMAIKHNKEVFVTPDEVSMDRLLPHDVFVLNEDNEITECSLRDKELKPSLAMSTLLEILKIKPAKTSIHTHSKNSVLVTLAWNGNEFKIANQEMIKGLYKGDLNERYCNTDTVKIPIIENTRCMSELLEPVTAAMKQYSEVNAVLIRRHGLIVWGKTWKAAKAQLEALEYLFEIALEMKKLGIDPSAPPEGENGIKEDS